LGCNAPSLHGLSMIKLSQNENPIGPSPRVKQRLRAEIEHLALYPQADAEPLTEALSARHGLPSSRITLSEGSGSLSLLIMIARHFTEHGGTVMISAQGYVNFLFSNMKRGGAISCPVLSVPRMGDSHNLEAMVDHARSEDVRVLILENPDNPTGTYIGRDRLADFLATIPAHVMVVMDGAYAEYAGHSVGADYPDLGTMQEQFPNLINLRTFSKAYGLAGLRVGYAVGMPEVMTLLRKRRVKLTVSSLAMVAACEALQDQEHLNTCLQTNAAERRYLEQCFDEMGLDYPKSVANFIMFDPGDMNAAAVADRLKQDGILVLELSPYGVSSRLRVTTGLHDQNECFVRSLRNIVDSI